MVASEEAGKTKAPKFNFAYYQERPLYWGYDGIPFLGAYGAVLACVSARIVALNYEAPSEYVLWLILPASGQLLLYLGTHWSVELRCAVRYRQVFGLSNATHIKVVPVLKREKVLLVPIVRQPSEAPLFLYQQRKFTYNESTEQFERVKFSVTQEVSHYTQSTGHGETSVVKTFAKYGRNNFDIPLPAFAELFKEHAVAPFFVFQMICVILWLMDEYWYYSLVTLVMLIILECQMVQKRLHDLGQLREMRIPARPMHVFRGNCWKLISSDQLLPGDIVTLARTPAGQAVVNVPCDVLLLQGTVVVNESALTGESVPQMKVALNVAPGSPEAGEPLDMKGRHKQHIVCAGTQIMTHENEERSSVFKKVPANGCVGYVLRSGFDTTQGKLVRTILFSADRVTVSSREALLFLLILVFFAVLASIYVLYDGIVVHPMELVEKNITNATCNGTNESTASGADDEDSLFNDTLNASCNATITVLEPRSIFKLVLAVSHILTSVVPPEFPITLSLAVNLSLVALIKYRIFCTEPFRVPYAGKVDTCCFDKTGTLTSDVMEVDRVEGLSLMNGESSANANGNDANGKKEKKEKKDKDEKKEKKESKEPPGDGDSTRLHQVLSFLTTSVIGGCSGLTVIDGEVVGDPLEKAALRSIGWQLASSSVAVSGTKKSSERLEILHRNPFASELQRMSVLVKHTGPGRGYGEDEAADGKTDDCQYLALVKGSCEVLRSRLREVPKGFDELNGELASQGLRVLCLAAKKLSCNGNRVEARDASRDVLEQGLEFCGMLVLRNAIKPHSASVVKQLRRSYHRVCMITGDNPLTACQVALDVGMAERPFLVLEASASEASASESPAKLVWRSREAVAGAQSHTPESSSDQVVAFDAQKTGDLAKMHALCIPGKALALMPETQVSQTVGFVTVFARVTPQQKQQVLLVLNETSTTLMVGDGTNDVGALKHAHVGISLLAGGPEIVAVPGGRRGRNQGEEFEMDGHMPLVRLGDASIASPFTYKGDTVKCCTQVLRCGRATLCTVMMMHKIMGINSVLSAFAMSVLTLDGVKLGDGQTAIESLFISACFFMISRSAPAKKLAKQHPMGSVFEWPVMLSMILQLLVHMFVLYSGWRLATSHRPEDFKRDLEGAFEPNLTNTIVFQLMASMHISSFIANYEGPPFMQPLSANRPLLGAMLIFVITLFVTASEVMPDLNELLSLVPTPTPEVNQRVMALLVLDIGGSVILAKLVNFIGTLFRGRAAEARARSLGLVDEDEEDDDEVKPVKQKKGKKVKAA